MMESPTGPARGAVSQPHDDSSAFAPYGPVTGAVLQAARLSSGASTAALACAAGVSEETFRSWESGFVSLACAPARHLCLLENALTDAGTDKHLIADLEPAAWCDLVLWAIADFEDPSCLLADPIAGEERFADLLAWAVTGHPPARYLSYVTPSPLVDRPLDKDAIEVLGRFLPLDGSLVRRIVLINS